MALVSTTVLGMLSLEVGIAAKLALASSLMFWSGCLSFVIGVLGLGKVVELIPEDVISAFTISAAFNIIFTQLGSLFQISVAASHAPILMLRNALVVLPTLKVLSCLCD